MVYYVFRDYEDVYMLEDIIQKGLPFTLIDLFRNRTTDTGKFREVHQGPFLTSQFLFLPISTISSNILTT